MNQEEKNLADRSNEADVLVVENLVVESAALLALIEEGEADIVI